MDQESENRLLMPQQNGKPGETKDLAAANAAAMAESASS